ncbi:MAG: phospholipase A [Burkholderiaceae bacterium]
MQDGMMKLGWGPIGSARPGSVGRIVTGGLIVGALVLSAGCSSMSEIMSRAQEPADLAGEQLGQAVYRHEGNFIIAGGSPDTTAKVQVSLKVRLAGRVFFGYSQTNLWDISRASLPFRDTTHRPSLFYYGEQQPLFTVGAYRHVYGVEHNSNGRDELDSRSLNQLFYRSELSYGDQRLRHWQFAAKVFAYVGKGDENQDIDDFRNHAEFRLRNTKPNGADYSIWWRPGKGGKGSGAIEFSTGLRKLGWDVPGFLMVQLFAGYGETLLDYNRREQPQLRVGYRLDRGP